MQKISKVALGLFAVIVIVAGIWYAKKPKNNNVEEQITKQSQEQTVTKLGVIGHFSGAYADYGIPMKNAVELAVEEFNKKQDDKKIELVFEDDNSDPKNAVSAMNKLASVDNLDYVISAQGSGVTSSIIPVAQNNQKILMITLASAPELTNGGDYIFRSVPSDTYQANKMNDFINQNLKSNKIAGLYLNDSYGVGIKNIIDSNSNVDNVIDEMFESSATDFRTQLSKIKESDADTLVIAAHDEFPIILKQIKELGLKINIITSETFKDDKMLSASSNNAEGVFVTFMATPEDNVNFNENYKNKFNEEPSAYSMYAYDGTIALLENLKNNSSSNEVKNNLSKIKFKGASGQFGFTKNGDRADSEYNVLVVKNGKFEEVK